MSKASREKGKRGEREFAAWLRERGVEARRGVQFQGGPESPDVVADLPGLHAEVKRTETFRIYDAIEQATSEAPPGAKPYVAHRRNKGEWLVVMRAEDWLELVRPKPVGMTTERPVLPGGCKDERCRQAQREGGWYDFGASGSLCEEGQRLYQHVRGGDWDAAWEEFSAHIQGPKDQRP